MNEGEDFWRDLCIQVIHEHLRAIDALAAVDPKHPIIRELAERLRDLYPPPG